MTAVLERPAPAAAVIRPRVQPLAVLPWLIVTAALVTGLLLTDTAVTDIAVYALYLALGVVLPGTLVHRAVRGSRGNLAEDLGVGAATGLLVQLAGWAFAAATGLQQVLWCWPLLVLIAFVAVPALRRHWRIADPEPLPVRWHWMIGGGLLIVVLWGAWIWSTNETPPATASYYQDLLYHLALVHEMTRSMPFEVPQLAGDALRYHYLSDADMAAASMITGIPAEVVFFRLWMVPIGAVAVLTVAVLAREVSGRWWAGPLAGTTAFIGIPLTLGGPVAANGGQALSFASPSQSYAMPLLALLTLVAVDLLRGRKLGAAWFLVPPLALACAGSKSSALPPLVAGIALAGAVLWIRDRAFPRAVAGLLVAVVVPMLIGTRLFAGGGAGTLGIEVFGLLRWIEPYQVTLGEGDKVLTAPLLPPGLSGIGAPAWAYVLVIVLWWMIMQAPRLLGLGGLGTRRLRADPAAWLLGGMIAAGAGAAWVFFHPSASQLYFFQCAVPFGVVLTTWLLAEKVRRWWVPVAGLVAGAAWNFFAPEIADPVNRESWAGWLWTLYRPVLFALAFVAAGAVLVLALRKSMRSVVVAVTAAVLGGSIAAGVENYLTGLTADHAKPEVNRTVFEPEMRAALWLHDNSAPEDVVATNVHCIPIKRYKPCDARAFWVAGLTGRRVLIESWGYSDKTVAANGVNGLRYVQQPSPKPGLYALNQKAIAFGDPADVRRLRNDYGVDYIFGDTRAGLVSPRLAESARLVHTEGTVSIYKF